MFEKGRQNVFTEEIKRIALSSNDDNRIQSIDSIKKMHMARAKI